MKSVQYDEVKDVKTTEHVDNESPGPKTKATFLGQVKWGWVFRCIIIVFILSALSLYIISRIYKIPTDRAGQAAASAIFLSGLLVIFLGSFITALFSPGKTITEPAIACALIVIFSTLTTGNPAGAVFGWIVPFFLGLAGAKVGEYVAAKVKNSRHLQKPGKAES